MTGLRVEGLRTELHTGPPIVRGVTFRSIRAKPLQ